MPKVEKEQEEKVETKFTQIQTIANKQSEMKIQEKEVIEGIKLLKKRKAGDQNEWNNEMIIEVGDEMIKSITTLFNRILREQNIPKQLEKMSIKTIHKKGSKLEMSNKRGIFLTNVLSKLFEKIIDNMKTKPHS